MLKYQYISKVFIGDSSLKKEVLCPSVMEMMDVIPHHFKYDFHSVFEDEMKMDS